MANSHSRIQCRTCLFFRCSKATAITAEVYLFFGFRQTFLFLVKNKRNYTAMDQCMLSMLPGYTHLFTDTKIRSYFACQFTFCVVTSILITYYLITRFVPKRGRSFCEAMRLMLPLREKINQIGRQRQTINADLDSTEDNCNIHYPLLRWVAGQKPEDGNIYAAVSSPQTGPSACDTRADRQQESSEQSASA